MDKVQTLRDLQNEFQTHTGRDYSAVDGVSPEYVIKLPEKNLSGLVISFKPLIRILVWVAPQMR